MIVKQDNFKNNLADPVAAGRNVELYVHRRGVEQGSACEVDEGPEREYAWHTLDYTRAAKDGFEMGGIEELFSSIEQFVTKTMA